MKNAELMTAKKGLNKMDSENQTYGCRHTNPDICSNNSIPGMCAFTSEDCICKKPPRSWKKIYEEMKKEKTTIQ